MTKMLRVGCAAVALASSSAGIAQQQGADDPGLADIVVTANKREELLSDVPAAISVLTGESLVRSGATQFSQYFDTVPGLAAVPFGQPGKGVVSLRGISTGVSQTNASVGTYINDVPFGSAGGLAIGGTFIADPNTFDVERIEVLKGPQGTLYGASTLGGLIKTVYAGPRIDATEAAIMLDGSAVEGGSLGYQANGMVNLSFGGTFAIRAVLSQRRDPGFIQSKAAGNLRDDANEADAYGGRIIALYQPNEAFAAELTAIYQNTRSKFTNLVDLDPVTLRPTVGDLATAETFVAPIGRLRYEVYAGKLSYDFGRATLTSVSSYGKYRERSIADQTNAFGFGVIVPYEQRITLGNVTQEIRLASPTGGTFEWLLGGFYTDQDNSWDFDIVGRSFATRQPVAGPFANIGRFRGDTRYKEVAGFANATWRFTDKLSVSGGLRYSENRQRYSYGRSGIIYGGPSTTAAGRSKDDVLTYAATLRFEPTKDALLYVSTSTGYRPGGPQVSNLTGLNLPTSFGPDETVNYEAGLKLSTLGGKLSLDASVFYIDWKDIQLLRTVTLQLAGSTVRRVLIENAGAASSRGFDFALRYRPITDLTLALGGGYTDARLDEAAASLGAVAGERIPYTPRWQLNGSLDYGFDVATDVRASIGASFRYVGSRTNYFAADPAGNLQARMPEYAMLDLRAGLTLSETLEILFRVNNVTNERAILAATSNAFNPDPPFDVLNVAGVVAQPRTYGITLTKRF